MRRGHQGAPGGWRGDNHRNFRPRMGSSQFRLSRGYLLDNPPRFQSPGTRGFHRSTHHDSDRDNFRFPRPQGQRQILPFIQQIRHNITERSSNAFNVLPEPCFRINTLGDVDFRHKSDVDYRPHGDVDFRQQTDAGFCHQHDLDLRPQSNDSQSNQRPLQPWVIPPFDMRQQNNQNQIYERRGYKKPFRRDSCETSKLPGSDFSGHRPHSSDYYGNNPAPDIDNSNSFSHSIDDTVDIIRKRLQNRNDTQHHSEQGHNDNNHVSEPIQEPSNNCQNYPQEVTQNRRRIQHQKINVQLNCDKMKNKIVHQLFKMDKDKIHRLMENPSSSSKFEYAISSLITESQNSFNRHMRSVAEKSLCSSGSEFINNDSNTVYEDTFMKQMQCILDPQDTVLLEDIKPLVMAEIGNLLQLDEFDHRLEVTNDYALYDNDQQKNFDQTSVAGEYAPHDYDYQSFAENDYGSNNLSEMQTNEMVQDLVDHPQSPKETKPSFQHQLSHFDSSTQEGDEFQNDRRKSLDKNSNTQRSSPPLPLFDPNTEHFSEDEDPFAELDNQYHVAVDHNFIEGDYTSPQQTPKETFSPNSTKSINKSSSFTPEKINVDVKKELDSQLMQIATSPLKIGVKNESSKQVEKQKEHIDMNIIKHENLTEVKNSISGASTTSKSSLQPNSRKRSVEQKPSHRKEKRKKSESSVNETSKQILNKNIIINVNDCASKSSEKCDSAKSIFNLFFSKDQSKSSNNETKDKNNETSSKEYSDKYVKRKETQKKTKSTEIKKKPNSNSSNHSIVSPTSTNESGNSSQTSKSDTKTKLKTFDIFEQPSKKTSVQHHSIRNTAAAPTATPKILIEKKKPETIPVRKEKRNVFVQTIYKNDSKGTQTLLRKITKATQTIPVSFEKSSAKSTDAFERMKEIDMEIQNLLQEKFKLYSSLESKNKIAATMQNLGMTVLNVTPTPDPEDDSSLNEDAIVEDFANIPVEELEQIAFESVQEDAPKSENKCHSHKAMSRDRTNSESSASKSKKCSKKEKSPNISLIEQIIRDDTPLEEIIPLEQFESTTSVLKRNSQPKRKVYKNKKKVIRKQCTDPPHLSASSEIRECSVVLMREDLNKMLNKLLKKKEELQTNESKCVLTEATPVQNKEENKMSTADTDPIVEEPVVNDLQIDMLDVSEDIVIGDVCEVKDDKETVEREDVSINEEVILDNSQSSADESVAQEASQAAELCKVYDYSTDENLRRDSMIVTGNADAVLAIECFENDFIATCLDGNVYHFSGEGHLLNTLRGSNLAVTCLTIVKEKYGTTVYTGSLDSRIRYYDLETGLEKGPECNVLSPIQTMDRAWDTIFVGTRTGFVLQFECKNHMLIPVSTVKFSEQSILALRALKEGPRKVLLVAARSEDVTIKDASTGLLLRTLQGPKMTVYTLLLEDGKVYCGTSSNQVHVFDYASGGHMGYHRGGKGAVCLRSAGGLVFAGCYDGCVYAYREGEPGPRAVLRGPKLMLLSLAVTNTKIIAGYKDRSLYIWKIPLAIMQEMVL